MRKLDGHCCKLEIRKYIILAHTAAHISSDNELVPEQGVSGTSTEHHNCPFQSPPGFARQMKRAKLHSKLFCSALCHFMKIKGNTLSFLII